MACRSHPKPLVLSATPQAANMLAAAYRSGKLPHALIFAGPVGIGKATLAFHLAHHLLKHPAFEHAPDALAVARSGLIAVSPDRHRSASRVLHLTRPMNDKTKSFKTVVTVDEIRKVSRFLSMTSHDGSYRVVIVDPGRRHEHQRSQCLAEEP